MGRGLLARAVALGLWAALAAAGCAAAGQPGPGQKPAEVGPAEMKQTEVQQADMKTTNTKQTEPKPAGPSPFPGPEAMEQGVQEPCVYCQVLYPARLAAHCPHCGDKRIVFRPARMMSRELAVEHVGELNARCSRMEEAVRTARPEVRPKALSELRRCCIGLLRDTLTYGVGESKPLIDRIHALDAELGPAGVE